jgi:hypothetical protein
MAVTIDARGLVLTEHEFSVPLDHAAPEGERITVFAREPARLPPATGSMAAACASSAARSG